MIMYCFKHGDLDVLYNLFGLYKYSVDLWQHDIASSIKSIYCIDKYVLYKNHYSK